jgi:hypothetical protein
LGQKKQIYVNLTELLSKKYRKSLKERDREGKEGKRERGVRKEEGEGGERELDMFWNK